MKLLTDVHRADAKISPDGRYRYLLTREWDRDQVGRICWVMLNPSTADAGEDDQTLRFVQAFSRRWGFGVLCVVNLFAFRTSSPHVLRRTADPVGPDNDEWIFYAAKAADTVVAAWGRWGYLHNRGLIVAERLRAAEIDLQRLGGPLANGHPRHPLYQPESLTLEAHR